MPGSLPELLRFIGTAGVGDTVAVLIVTTVRVVLP